MKFPAQALAIVVILGNTNIIGGTITLTDVHQQNLLDAAAKAASRRAPTIPALPSPPGAESAAEPSAGAAAGVPPSASAASSVPSSARKRSASASASSAKKASRHHVVGPSGRSRTARMKANHRDELQTTGAMVAGRMVMTEGSMKLTQLQKKMSDYYHGTPGEVVSSGLLPKI